jgi:hypothetical protein
MHVRIRFQRQAGRHTILEATGWPPGIFQDRLEQLERLAFPLRAPVTQGGTEIKRQQSESLVVGHGAIVGDRTIRVDQGSEQAIRAPELREPEIQAVLHQRRGIAPPAE